MDKRFYVNIKLWDNMSRHELADIFIGMAKELKEDEFKNRFFFMNASGDKVGVAAFDNGD
jgi:hypothetical protein